jgi:hypothetical protein
LSFVVLGLACLLTFFLLGRQSSGSLPFFASTPTEAEISVRRRREFVSILVVYIAIQIVSYTANGAAYFYTRYLILLPVPAVGVFAFLLYRLALSRLEWLACLTAVVLTAGALTTILGWHGVRFGMRLNSLQTQVGTLLLRQVELAEAVRTKGERIGALKTGTLAFFVEGAVNLNGRVNFAAYQARRQGKLLEYILGERIDLLVDYDIHFRPAQEFFQVNEDVARYLTRIAPSHPPVTMSGRPSGGPAAHRPARFDGLDCNAAR